jgi:hypothetical protein
MLKELPEELLSIIATYGSIADIYSLRRTLRAFHTSLADDLDRRYFEEYMQHYTVHSL